MKNKKYVFFEKDGTLMYTLINDETSNHYNFIKKNYKYVEFIDKFPDNVEMAFFSAYYIKENKIQLDIEKAKKVYIDMLKKEVDLIFVRLDELEYRYVMESEKIKKIKSVRNNINSDVENLDFSFVNNMNDLLNVRPTILDIYEELLK